MPGPKKEIARPTDSTLRAFPMPDTTTEFCHGSAADCYSGNDIICVGRESTRVGAPWQNRWTSCQGFWPRWPFLQLAGRWYNLPASDCPGFGLWAKLKTAGIGMLC